MKRHCTSPKSFTDIVQLDYQAPINFNLRYVADPNKEEQRDTNDESLPAGYSRPVVIHRAVIGSFEVCHYPFLY